MGCMVYVVVSQYWPFDVCTTCQDQVTGLSPHIHDTRSFGQTIYLSKAISAPSKSITSQIVHTHFDFVRTCGSFHSTLQRQSQRPSCIYISPMSNPPDNQVPGYRPYCKLTYLAIPAAEMSLSEVIPWFALPTMDHVRSVNDLPVLIILPRECCLNEDLGDQFANTVLYLSVALQNHFATG